MKRRLFLLVFVMIFLTGYSHKGIEKDNNTYFYAMNFRTDGYSTYQFVEIENSINELRIDNVYEYSILKKEK